MTSYLLRAATYRDTRAVQDLARRVQRELRTVIRVPEEGGNDGMQDMLWVVEAGRGEIVGCCGAREGGGGSWDIHSLYLSPEWRGFGLGRALVEHALRTVHQQGGVSVNFGVSPECCQAIMLVQRMGFAESGALPDGTLWYVRGLGQVS